MPLIYITRDDQDRTAEQLAALEDFVPSVGDVLPWSSALNTSPL